jgi:3'(2'), 5'-bisphosphate nucleotidase
VVSEEDAGSLTHRQSYGRFWLIDPLDGTKEFITRNGEFTVNIALIEDGRCVLGVVYASAIDALYWGGVSLGAFRCMDGQTVAIKVSASNPEKAPRVVASKSHLNEATRSMIDRLGEARLSSAVWLRARRISTQDWRRLANGIRRQHRRCWRVQVG